MKILINLLILGDYMTIELIKFIFALAIVGTLFFILIYCGIKLIILDLKRQKYIREKYGQEALDFIYSWGKIKWQ